MKTIAELDLGPIVDPMVGFTQVLIGAAGGIFGMVMAYAAIRWGAPSLWRFFKSLAGERYSSENGDGAPNPYDTAPDPNDPNDIRNYDRNPEKDYYYGAEPKDTP